MSSKGKRSTHKKQEAAPLSSSVPDPVASTLASEGSISPATAPSASNPTSGNQPAPSGKPQGTGTPRHQRISGTTNHFKRKRAATALLNSEMDILYAFKECKNFLEDHVPGSDLSPSQLVEVGNFDSVKYNNIDETVTYAPFCKVFKKLYSQSNLNYTMLATGLWPESGNADRKPDMCSYSTEGPGDKVYDLGEPLDVDADELEWKVERRLHSGRTAWAWISTLIEVKTHKDAAPFECIDGKWVPANRTSKGISARAQMVKYAAEVQLRQHRKFVFTVFIWQDQAWLMRWDRAGAIVSTPINYIQDPAPLLNFFYRFARLSPSMQGYDTSASLASEREVELFKSYAASLPEGSYRKKYALHAVSETNRYPVHSMYCPDVGWLDDDKRPNGPDRTYKYLVGRFSSGSRSPTGRGGKGFIAYDVDRARLVFLKEYWCGDAPGIHRELDTYKLFKETGVGHVATAIAGGDVEGEAGQVTMTQELLTGLNPRPVRRVHHRFVVWEVGRPLETYRRGEELVWAVAEALLGHEDAWKKAQILHRDVSMSNILIDVDTGNAFLNDWDLCKLVSELGVDASPSQYGRSGTWPYMSGTLLEYPKKPNELADDLESFVYVVSLALLRFHKHDLSFIDPRGKRPKLSRHIAVMFDAADEAEGGHVVGGERKIGAMVHGDPGFKLASSNSPQLSILHSELYSLGKSHYSKLNLDELQAKYGVTRLPQEHPQEAEGTYEGRDMSALLGPRTFALARPASDNAAASPGAVSTTTKDFNSHDPILAIFADLPKSGWKVQEKIDDQFTELPFMEMVDPIGSTGGSSRKRRSQPGSSTGRRRRSKQTASSSTNLGTVPEPEDENAFT